jgi:prolipoprotein diacylglyceryl transferase
MRPWLVIGLDALLGTGAGELLAPNYIVMLSVAIVLGAALAVRQGFAHGFDMRRGLLALALGYPGALLGARLLTVLTRVPDALAAGNAALLWEGGLAAYGGFIGGIFAVWLGLGRRDFLAFGDVTAATLGLGTCVTRIGCFLAGCDYGTVSSVPWAVRFPAGSPAFQAHLAAGWVGPLSGASLPVHPTELYESALGLAICAGAIYWMARRRGRPLDGRVFLAAIAAYAAGRFCVEMLRGDVDRGVWLGVFSTSQLVSLTLLALVGAVALRRFGPPGRAPAFAAAAVAALAVLLPARASEAKEPAVAVVDTAAAGTPGASVRAALADLLADAIGTGHVMAPVTVRAILSDKGVVPDKMKDPVSWAAAARILKVDLVIALTVTLEGEDAGFASVVYDKVGKTRWRVDEPCPRCTPAQLEDAARNLASRIADAIVDKTPKPPGGFHGEAPGAPATGPAPGGGGGSGPHDPFGSTSGSESTGTGTGGAGATGTGGAAGDVFGLGTPEATATSSVPFPVAHPLSIRLGLGPSFVIGRRTVPTLGYEFLVEGAYTLKARTELGGQFIFFTNADAKHFTFSAFFEWKIGRARKGALYAGGSIGITHVVFDTAAKSVSAFDTRARLGWEALLGKWFGLRLEPLNFALTMNAAFGVIPAWEPRVMLSFRH